MQTPKRPASPGKERLSAVARAIGKRLRSPKKTYESPAEKRASHPRHRGDRVRARLGYDEDRNVDAATIKAAQKAADCLQKKLDLVMPGDSDDSDTTDTDSDDQHSSDND